MLVLDLTYIHDNTRLQELADYCIWTIPQQEEVTKQWNYVENKVFLDVDKDIFSDDWWLTYDFTEEFKFIVLNLFECYWETKDIIKDVKLNKSIQVDDVTQSFRDIWDFKMYRWIPCDEDTITSILWYSQNYWIWNMTIDLSDVI